MILTLIETSCKKLSITMTQIWSNTRAWLNLERIHAIFIIHIYVLLVPLHMICDEHLLNRTMINYPGNTLIKKFYLKH